MQIYLSIDRKQTWQSFPSRGGQMQRYSHWVGGIVVPEISILKFNHHPNPNPNPNSCPQGTKKKGKSRWMKARIIF
jgi:hypothetical protein